MVKNQYKLITIIGNVGAGKTTLTNLLAYRLTAKKVPADDLYKTNPFFPLAVKNREKWSFISDLWFLYERIKLAELIPKYLQKTHVVVDSGLLMSWVYAHSRLRSGCFTNDKWEMYQIVYNELIKGQKQSDVVVYIQASIETLKKRIKKRGRKFETKYYTGEYLENLEKSLLMVVTKLKKQQLEVVSFNTNKYDIVSDSLNLQTLTDRILENGRSKTQGKSNC